MSASRRDARFEAAGMPAMMSDAEKVELFNSLVGQQRPGGCEDCEAFAGFETVEPAWHTDAYRIATKDPAAVWWWVVHHDPDCTWLRARNRRCN